MEHIHLQDSTITEAEVNGKSLDGQRGHALLVPSGDMSLAERLAESVEIRVEHDEQGRWNEVRRG